MSQTPMPSTEGGNMQKENELDKIVQDTEDRYQNSDKVIALLRGIFYVFLYIARRKKGIF